MNADDTEQVQDYPFRSDAPLDPPPQWAELREGCPVAPVRLPSGDQAMLLTRYQDVRSVLSDRRFSRQLGTEGAARIGSDGAETVFENAEAASLTTDHERWRRPMHKSFTARRVNAMQPRVEAMTEQLVDEMMQGPQPADLLATVGFPLPVWVICDLLGMPDVDRDDLARWSNSMLSMSQYSKEQMAATQAEFDEHMRAHIATKRAEPGEDLLSELITVVDEGQTLTERELTMIAQGILVAGHETTSNMIGKMMAMFLSDRTRWEQLVADPSLVRTAVEEALRFDSNSGFGLPRFITEEVELGGQSVPSGTTVICSMGAANRDAAAFEGAETMDLGRSPNQHIAFGAGPYACVGQALARTELQTVLRVLLRRLPTLALAVPPEQLKQREGMLVGGFESVPVRW